MQLKSLRITAMTLAGAVFFAAALPVPHTSAQTTGDPAVSSEQEAAQVRIDRAVLDLVILRTDRRTPVIAAMLRDRQFAEQIIAQIAWIEEIESGDPRIMYETALRLRDGDGLPQHRDAAVTWLERAGDHGVPEGLFEASRMLLDDPDLLAGQSWGKILLSQAARKGVTAAQKELGMREIAGAPRDGRYHRGYLWLLLARANGAQVNDAALAEASEHLSEEDRQAARTSVRKALGKDLLSLAWPFEEDVGARELWQEELRIALHWQECGRALPVLDGARQAGDAAAEHETAVLYEEGTCVDQDAARALEHYNAALNGGHMRSAFRLSLLYYDGRGTVRDPALAQRWFKVAALTLVGINSDPAKRQWAASLQMPRTRYRTRELPPELVAEIDWLAEIEDGDPRIMYETALRVRDGDGLPQVRYAAEVWLSQAGSRGVPEAYYDLGRTLLDAPLYPIHPERGVLHLARAGRDGFVPAQVELGRRYANGDQVQQWDHAAYVWLLMAEENGADVAALREEVGARLSNEDRKTARAEAETGTYYPLVSQ